MEHRVGTQQIFSALVNKQMTTICVSPEICTRHSKVFAIFIGSNDLGSRSVPE